MRTTPTPKMTAEAFKRKVDYFEGDIVQIIGGEHAGRIAMIISIGSYTNSRGFSSLIYNLKLSDSQGIRATANMFSLVRHGDDAEIQPQNDFIISTNIINRFGVNNDYKSIFVFAGSAEDPAR